MMEGRKGRAGIERRRELEEAHQLLGDDSVPQLVRVVEPGEDQAVQRDALGDPPHPRP